MTRQKRELMKKIAQIELWIAADEKLGCGFAPSSFYDPLYEQIDEYMTELARLSHFSTVDRYMYDFRGDLVDMR